MIDIARRMIMLERADDYDGWRAIARRMLMAGLPPDAVNWSEPGGVAGDLFAINDAPLPEPAPDASSPSVPRTFPALAEKAILHRDPARFDLLYRILWRLQRDGRLMEDATDPDMSRIAELARQVRRDIHKMRAFVRFRAVEAADGAEHFIAWFEPEHHILRANAAFFVNRFTNMRWSILTPAGSLHWDGKALQEGPPAQRSDAPGDDPTEALWRGYYASIFNPARLKIDAMLKEMPRKYWKNMPETALIPALVAGAQMREQAMVDAGRDLFEQVDQPRSLSDIADAIRACRRCEIGCNGTRAVAGEGIEQAQLMIVGEQPGDVEEAESRPFVGPAGRLLRAHLEEAGLDPARAWLTNAVKHFKYEPRGKRRIHQTPTAREIDICRWWVESERRLVRPRIILALGASAARAMLHKTVSVQKERGRAIALADDGEVGAAELWLTTHPSYLLRLPEAARPAEEARFAQDLKAVARRLAQID